MGRAADLGKATRLAAAFCLILVVAVMIWRFKTTGEISGSDLGGAAVCLVAFFVGIFLSREDGRG